MRFFSKTRTGTQCQNQLQKKIFEYIRTKNRKIIHACEVDEFKNTINAVINEMNTANPRCRPVHKDWWQPEPGRNKDWILNLYFIEITLYAEAD